MIGRVDFDHAACAAPPHRSEAGTGRIGGAIGLGSALDDVSTIGRDAPLRRRERRPAVAASYSNVGPAWCTPSPSGM